MQARWFLTQFYADEQLGINVPVCSAYGGHYLCPTLPSASDGWALVQMQCDLQQIEAAAQDSRVLVLPLLFDPTALPQTVIDTYSAMGATSGMSLAALLAKLAESEPVYGHSL